MFPVVRFIGLGVLAISLGNPAAEQRAPDGDKVQGVWRLVSYSDDEGSTTTANKMRVEIRGNKWTQRRQGVEMDATFTLDQTTQPNSIDILYTSCRAPFLGIYEIDGDNLKICICLGAVREGDGKREMRRPTKFVASKGAGQEVWVLKRFGK
jgi:uncharacterized protein (TIGR03067 family)